MKQILINIALLFSVAAYGQQPKLNSHLGLALLQTPSGKQFAFERGFHFGTEFHLKGSMHLATGLGYSGLQYNTPDSFYGRFFHTRHFLYLPLSLKFYSIISQKSSFFVDLGFDLRYNMSYNREAPPGREGGVSFKNAGFNAGFRGSGGIRTIFSRSFFMEFGIGGQSDFMDAYKSRDLVLRGNREWLVFALQKRL